MADLTRKTANLFDKDNTIVYSAYINTSDAWVNDSGSYSIKIPCLGSTTYTLSVGTSLPIFRLYESSDSDVEPTSYATGGTPISRIIRGENLSQYSFTTDANSVYIIFQGSASALNDWINSLMLNAGSEPLPYEPYGWVHSLRKLTTATEAVENPLYSDGTAITAYTIKGNTETSGNPSPQNPITIEGVGNKTANLSPNNTFTNTATDTRSYLSLTFQAYSDSGFLNQNLTNVQENKRAIVTLTAASGTTRLTVVHNGATQNIRIVPYFSAEAGKYTLVADVTGYNPTVEGGIVLSNIMILSGEYTLETIPPYEPTGYKIPISSGQQTIDIYIGDLPLLKSLDGTAVDEISNGTLTRRVDSDGSVLPTPTTTQITMPSIPTTDGANSITVDTTVQPSEFTATWTGWHNAYVKEKSENLWDNRGFSANTIDNTHNHVISNNLGTTISTTEGKEVTVIQSNYPTGNVSYQNGFFMIDVDYSKYAVGDIITLSFDYIVNEVHALSSQTATTLYAGKNNNIVSPILSSGDWKISGRLTVVITIIENMQPYLEVRLCGNSITVKNIMLNTGSTALPYEPYWK